MKYQIFMTQAVILAVCVGGCIMKQVEGNAAQPDQTATRSDATVAYWKFDGDLKDSSGRGHDLKAAGAKFGPGHSGQALKTGFEGSVLTSSDLQLAPGFRIECWVCFERHSSGWPSFVKKNTEYILRLDPAEYGGHFSFFVYLDGWEPGVSSKVKAEPGTWYHIIAEWDGFNSTLEVNGEKTSVKRTGSPRAGRSPLEVCSLDGMLDEVRIENMMLPRIKMLYAAAGGLPFFSGTAKPGQDPVVGNWKFDGDLRDASSQGHEITTKDASFGPGHSGQALQVGTEGSVPSSPDLQMAPGLKIDCWVFFEKHSPGFPAFVIKEREYQLRVDPAPPKASGLFSFYVFLNGWEPKVSSTFKPEPGNWYHLVAQWDGFNATLEVNGEKTSVQRLGMPRPTNNPLKIGALDGMIDELRIENPMFPAMQKYLAEAAEAPQRGSGSQDHFGKGAGWPGWTGMYGARVAASGDRLEITLPDSNAMAINPAFNLDLNQYRYVCCDISSPVPVMLIFITDAGYGTAYLPATQASRTSVADLSSNPSWRGKLKLLALLAPGAGSRGIQMENLWVSGKPEGKPYLQVQRIVWDHAILSIGKEEKVSALVEARGSEGLEVRDATASIILPKGIKCAGDKTRELGTLPTGAKKTVEWTVIADTETSGKVTVVMKAPDCAQASKRGFVFAGSFTQLFPAVKNIATTYYIDSVNGLNGNPGTSPDSPWKDFTNINGKTLGAGDRLLIKRGSVINQELRVSAKGAKDNWAEIGAYGTGTRPTIRRNWHISDRCVLITDPDYLWVRGLYVTCAASGIYVSYSQPNHAGLFIDDCIASHIEGRYSGYLNSTGIPEWRDIPWLDPDGYCGIMVGGSSAKDITFSNCEMFHTSSAFRIKGERVTLDRMFAHSCYVHNTCPHPYLVDTRKSMMKNCVLNASGGHASRGTMGIMLGGMYGMILFNNTIRNMPDSLTWDQGGVDFESGGNCCLIDHCTFENNAGAAIEVLGLQSPQAKNVEIRNSRFIKDNWVKKNWGPAEIYIWESAGKNSDPNIVCSDGTIHGNGYVLVPGVAFYANKAEALTSWRLFDNAQYQTAEELRKAMPLNDPPDVDAGDAVYSDKLTLQLAGSVKDDGRPAGARLKIQWEVLEGPASAEVSFENEASSTTKATFAKPGDYLLRLVGDDSELWTSDMVAVHVLPKGASAAKAWEFNRQLDKEGWTEENLGTRDRKEGTKDYEVTKPVKYVSGGYYIVCVEKSTNACLLSPEDLSLDISKHKTITVRFHNHTPAASMRFSFTTEASPDWNEANGQFFEVTPNDNGPREYAADMSKAPGWKGKLKQLRFDFATGAALTGTCRIDYVRIDSSN